MSAATGSHSTRSPTINVAPADQLTPQLAINVLADLAALREVAVNVFRVLATAELMRKQVATERLGRLLAEVDIFAREPLHEDYVPGTGLVDE